MAVIISDIVESIEPGDDGPHEVPERVASMEERLRTLEAAHRDLSNYCRSLENACREAFAECPGTSPFPYPLYR